MNRKTEQIVFNIKIENKNISLLLDEIPFTIHSQT